MKIITHACHDCGTVVAANELESRRVMKCPGINCEEILQFNDLPQGEQEFFMEYREQYQI